MVFCLKFILTNEDDDYCSGEVFAYNLLYLLLPHPMHSRYQPDSRQNLIFHKVNVFKSQTPTSYTTEEILEHMSNVLLFAEHIL